MYFPFLQHVHPTKGLICHTLHSSLTDDPKVTTNWFVMHSN